MLARIAIASFAFLFLILLYEYSRTNANNRQNLVAKNDASQNWVFIADENDDENLVSENLNSATEERLDSEIKRHKRNLDALLKQYINNLKNVGKSFVEKHILQMSHLTRLSFDSYFIKQQ